MEPWSSWTRRVIPTTLLAPRTSPSSSPARRCPSISPHWEDPRGVPISAILWGSRRSKVVPLVMQAFDWQHGVFSGSGMGAETTAAATGVVGVVRRDPMAMLPFCGYNMADYFAHWLKIGEQLKNPPLIFRVKWFRRDQDGNFLWPGYGENIRVLKWVLERIRGTGGAKETALGYLPTPGAIDTEGLALLPGAMEELTSVDTSGWLNGVKEMEEFYTQFGERLPGEIWNEHRNLRNRLEALQG